MQRTKVTLFALLLIAAPTMVGFADDKSGKKVSLFNGKDLTGWATKGGSAKETLRVGAAAVVSTTLPRRDATSGRSTGKCAQTDKESRGSSTMFRRIEVPLLMVSPAVDRVLRISAGNLPREFR